MFNNGQCYIWIPSFLTISTLTTEAAATVNAVHTALGLPGTSFQAGDQNPYILTLNDLDMGGAPFTRGVGSELACCGPINNKSFLSVNYLALIVSFGGEVEGYPVWFELTDISLPCPFSTEDPKETWETWGVSGDSHVPIQVGDKWYRSSAVGQSGALLNASAWVPLLSGGQVVLTAEQYAAIDYPTTPTP